MKLFISTFMKRKFLLSSSGTGGSSRRPVWTGGWKGKVPREKDPEPGREGRNLGWGVSTARLFKRSKAVVELKQGRSGYELVGLSMEALGPDTVVDGSIMNSSAVSTAVHGIMGTNKIKTKGITTSVAGHSVIVKVVSIPASDEAELAYNIELEAQQHVPFNIDVNLSYQVRGARLSSNNMDIMLVAVKREKISNQSPGARVPGGPPL